MHLTSLLLVLDEEYNHNDCILDAISSAGMKCELLVYNSRCENPIVIEELRNISTVFIDHDSILEASYSEAVNSLLSISSGDFICIMQSIGYLEQDWMLKLREASERLFKSGIIYINTVDSIENNDYALNSNDELEPIQNNDNKVENIIFFKNNFLSIIGGLHPQLSSTLAFNHFAKRFYFSGFTNYAVPGNSMIKMYSYQDTMTTSPLNFREISKQTERSRDYFIPLFPKTASHDALIESLSSHGEALFSVKLGAVVLTKLKLSKLELEEFTQIADTFSVNIELLPASYYDNNILKNRILILFK